MSVKLGSISSNNEGNASMTAASSTLYSGGLLNLISISRSTTQSLSLIGCIRLLSVEKVLAIQQVIEVSQAKN